jgi:hypothetical protein
MSTANKTRQSVMSLAWSFKREEMDRAFADCLRGAWKMIKGLTKAVAKLFNAASRSAGLHGSVVRSAAWDRFVSHRYRRAAFGAANSMVTRVSQ